MTKDRYLQHAPTAGSWRPSSSRFHWKQLYCWGRGGRKQHSKHISEDHTEVTTGSVTHRPLNISLEDGEWKCVCTALCEKRFLSTPPRGTCGGWAAGKGKGPKSDHRSGNIAAGRLPEAREGCPGSPSTNTLLTGNGVAI